MENISPFLKSRLENRNENTIQNSPIPKVDIGNVKLNTLENDKVELSNNKKTKLKKIMKYMAAAAFVAGVCIASVKYINASKAKKK